ncbi:hypothetical protein [Syntrophorhabdus aromaticivorans]|uniref:Uncharacterized protein n=1 Tax=Syntrophorhabdus aromaticivorans TaxID=328301 RepID=A0A971S149_9BACT|nr:hypothetical protein [Syntrophorhabdus aromaticivorans]NLW36125.1 hypothetical protein [Syntrophorhabdus aromaticivorans]
MPRYASLDIAGVSYPVMLRDITHLFIRPGNTGMPAVTAKGREAVPAGKSRIITHPTGSPDPACIDDELQ